MECAAQGDCDNVAPGLTALSTKLSFRMECAA